MLHTVWWCQGCYILNTAWCSSTSKLILEKFNLVLRGYMERLHGETNGAATPQERMPSIAVIHTLWRKMGKTWQYRSSLRLCAIFINILLLFVRGWWHPCLDFGNVYFGFMTRVDVKLACFITYIQVIPQNHLWCDTCWPLDSQHCSWAFSDPRIWLRNRYKSHFIAYFNNFSISQGVLTIYTNYFDKYLPNWQVSS